MRTPGFTRDLLRPAGGDEAHRVTFVELFFDLVFVFAVTQISHHLIASPSLLGLVQTIMLTMAIWWVWVDTAWVTNWLNPEQPRVRALLIVLMLGALLMSSAIPEAFAYKGVQFTVSLVAIQLARGVFTVLAFARHRADNAMNFARITAWAAASGVFWIVGGFAQPEARLWLWLIALAIDFSGPVARFYVPGFAASETRTWNVSGEHMAERVSLFAIIALGESIVVTGATFGQLPLSWQSLLAFLAAFAGTVLMWLIYFNHAQRSGTEHIVRSSDAGAVARVAYTYIPVVLVIGIVLAAVGDALVLESPSGRVAAWAALVIAGSAVLYIAANVLFVRSIGGPWLAGHLSAIVVLLLLALLALFTPALSALALSWLSNVVLLLVVIADELLFRRKRHRSTAVEAMSTD
ncbi:low temperature requirement protein A [Parafrigoribacterium soli]|uniref:low temperature requirement protein A n=1 Tax=Parafrigoribacterium soli TaxID=3144663 RepID=UPI0032EE8BB0